MLESILPQYNDSTRDQKPRIAKEVVAKVKGWGGRFLRPVDGMWEEVNDKEAKEKVGNTLRSLRASSRKKAERDRKRLQREASGDGASALASQKLQRAA